MSRSPDQPNRSLFIRCIPSDTRNEDLRDIFSKFGVVKDVYIPRDYYTRKPRGFAYVEFERLRDAENVIRNSGRIRLFGRDLDVEFAQGDRKTPNEMKRRYTNFRTSRDGDGGRSMRRYKRSPSISRSRSRSRSRERRRSFSPGSHSNRSRKHRNYNDRGNWSEKGYPKNGNMMGGEFIN